MALEMVGVATFGYLAKVSVMVYLEAYVKSAKKRTRDYL